MKIALLFPGYGSQFVGMAKELYDEHRIIQEYFEEASNCLDINFVKLCFASSDAEIGKMNHAYTSIFLVSSSIVALLLEQGIRPAAVAGYNQGEFAAIFAGKGISLPDGLYLLNKYAGFYEAALKNLKVGAIRVAGLPTLELEKMCEDATIPESRASIAIYQAESINIVVGDKIAVQKVRDAASARAQEDGVDIEPVSLDVGLHSSYMNPVVEQFRMYLEKVDFKDLMIPMIESITGAKIEQGEQARQHVIKRITSPVQWVKTEQELEPYDIIVEIGPGTMLSEQAKKRYPDKTIMAINKQADIDALKKIAGVVAPKEDTPDNDKKDTTQSESD